MQHCSLVNQMCVTVRRNVNMCKRRRKKTPAFSADMVQSNLFPFFGNKIAIVDLNQQFLTLNDHNHYKSRVLQIR